MLEANGSAIGGGSSPAARFNSVQKPPAAAAHAPDSVEGLPAMELRKRVVARAELSLAEARALLKVLEQLDHAPFSLARGRSALGIEPVTQPRMRNDTAGGQAQL